MSSGRSLGLSIGAVVLGEQRVAEAAHGSPVLLAHAQRAEQGLHMLLPVVERVERGLDLFGGALQHDLRLCCIHRRLSFFVSSLPSGRDTCRSASRRGSRLGRRALGGPFPYT